jgi:hypothetical protein
MSFEGYYQAICTNGHRFDFGVTYDWDEVETEICDEIGCGAHVAWWNLVDDTNCDRNGEIPEDEFEVLTPEVIETCDKCKNTHRVKEATYKIPTDKGHIVDVVKEQKDEV